MTKKQMAHKMQELDNLGAASKQLSRKKKNIKTVRRCHIAMAYIVSDIWPKREVVLKERPELREFFTAMLLLHRDCKNGYAQRYIDRGNQ